MKKKLFYKIIFVILFSVTACFSQEEEDQLISVFSTKENSMDLLSKFSSKATQALPVNIQNSVFIQQIGNNNSILADIKAEVSDVDLNQEGNTNSIYLDKSASEINQFIKQDGNNNSVVDFNYKYNNPVNSNFTQSGNNLNIVNIGSNSISKELTIKQTGNSGSVIILNK